MSGENLNYPNKPIIMLGLQRSGTSLVRTFLAAHRNIAIPPRGESQYFKQWRRDPSFFDMKENRNAFVQDFLAKSKCGEWGCDFNSFRMPTSDSEDFYGKFFCELMSFYANSLGKPRWGEKSTTHIDSLKHIHKAIPQAAYIVVVRDPRDTYCSAKKVSWNEGKKLDPYKFAAEWANAYSRALGYLISNNLEFTIVRHESMVTDLESTLKRLFKYLNEEYTPDLLTPQKVEWEQNSSFGDQSWTQSGKKQFTNEVKVDPETIGRWKKLLDKSEITKIESGTKGALRTFGYQETSSPKRKALIEASKALFG